jgi:23S rRNA (pseudouridine1915-N3)-methyltransferase
MRIVIGAVGRMKSGPETELLQRYWQRAAQAGRPLGFAAIEIREFRESQAADARRRRAEEAAQLLPAAKAGTYIVALDAAGADMDSQTLAELLRARLEDATPELHFLIGGPDGLGEAVLAAAARRIAFGKATWPHQLVRVMLAEQIYRAATILAGHPYHRS